MTYIKKRLLGLDFVVHCAQHFVVFSNGMLFLLAYHRHESLIGVVACGATMHCSV